MSGALANLIRVHRWTLDERRRTLTDLEKLEDKLRADLVALEADLEREREVATKSPELAYAYPAFASAAKQRREKIQRSIEEVGRETERARRQVEAAFQEVKKYELALEAAEKRQQDKLKRREQAALDEMGLALHARKRNRDAG